MTVPSWQFLVFAFVGAAVFNLSRRPTWHAVVWLVLNLAFVWSFSRAIVPLFPFAGFLTFGYVAQLAARERPRAIGAMAIILVLMTFLWLKRYSFVPQQTLLPSGYLTIGLSYVFFRVMHLVIDASQGGTKPIGILSYVNYTLNFPAFISGPIQRYESYEADANLALGISELGVAAWRMILGAFKVLILSAALHAWQRDLIMTFATDPSGVTMIMNASLIMVLYALFLFANFSGYTDFVTGIARLYRLRLPENFDRPFAAGNFIEFWGRWHITLSQWLRSYVFNTLLLTWMRRDKAARSKQYPVIVAFFVTFFLIGAWHGQTSEFLFFGVLQGAGVAGVKLYQLWMCNQLGQAGYGNLCLQPIYRAAARGLTFTWFTFTLLWFWATWKQLDELAEHLGIVGTSLAAFLTLVASSVVLAIPDMLGPFGTSVMHALNSRYTRTAASAAMVLALAIGALVLNLAAPEIVYKQF